MTQINIVKSVEPEKKQKRSRKRYERYEVSCNLGGFKRLYKNTDYDRCLEICGNAKREGATDIVFLGINGKKATPIDWE